MDKDGYDLTDAYKTIEESYDNKYDALVELHSDKWEDCPRCNCKPKLWEFDNGRVAACKCATRYGNEYKIRAISINEHLSTHYDLTDYAHLGLRDNWNNHTELLRRELTIDHIIKKTL